MQIITYDTFNEYVASTSYKKDDLCFIKALGAWYQGGKVKTGPMPYTSPEHCHDHHCHDEHMHHCDEHVHHCDHHHHHCEPHPCGWSVITIDGVEYWAFDGRIIHDDAGMPVRVYKTQDFSGFADKTALEALRVELLGKIDDLKGYVDSKYADLKSYVDNRFNNLAKLRINGVVYDLNDGGIIDIVTDNTVSVQYNLTHAVSSNKSTKIVKGSAFSTTITAETGYKLGAVTYTMGGQQFTATGGAINIANVTGDIVINASASISTFTVTWKAGTGCTGTTITEAANYGDVVYASKHDSEFTVNAGYENGKWDKASAIVTGNVVFTKSATAVAKTYNIYYGMSQDTSASLLPDLSKSVSTTGIAGTKINAVTNANGDWLHLWIPSELSVAGHKIVFDRDNMESLKTKVDFAKKGDVQINGTSYVLYYSGNTQNPDPTFKAGFTKKIELQ